MIRRSVALVLAMLLATPKAQAAPKVDDAKVRCAAAYERAQELRRQDRLSAARAQLVICKENCSTAFAQDCERWRAEVDALLPTVRLRPIDERGRPLKDVHVLLDGLVLSDPKLGSTLQVDAGDHVFRFESPSCTPVEVRVALHGGEREREISVILEPPAAPAPKAVETRMRPPPFMAYVLGATSIAALGLAGGLSLKGHLDVSNLQSTCAPRCTQSDVDDVTQVYDVAWISAGVGLLALAATVLIWRPWQRVPAETSALNDPWLLPVGRYKHSGLTRRIPDGS